MSKEKSEQQISASPAATLAGDAEVSEIEPESSFQPDLLLEIARVLAHRGWKTTLLELMIANCEILGLCLPVLLREVTFKHPFDPWGQFKNLKPDSPARPAFLRTDWRWTSSHV
jgi:hypothetical protein